jgi:hypothetical protein
MRDIEHGTQRILQSLREVHACALGAGIEPGRDD